MGTRWFTFPSVTYPYKNHARLVRAFAEVAAAEPDVSLVLTGRADTAEPELMAEIARLGPAGTGCAAPAASRGPMSTP